MSFNDNNFIIHVPVERMLFTTPLTWPLCQHILKFISLSNQFRPDKQDCGLLHDSFSYPIYICSASAEHLASPSKLDLL